MATHVGEQYELVQLLRGGRDAREASLSRARRISDGQRVLLKIPRTSSARDVEPLRWELGVAQSLDSKVVLHPIALRTFGGMPVLVLDDFAGAPLREQMKAPLDVGTALEIATGLVSTVESVHRSGIVHRDIKPQNVMFDPRSSVVKLTGFGIASAMPGEHWAVGGRVEGTPPYMSPEQTGRLNRPIDARSDLYSIGVILYEMLTGRLPFEAQDLLGWMHCHITRAPMPLTSMAPHVPAIVSDLVMRLLAKLPEDRYQTAAGLLVDLERCRRAWNATRSVSPFVLGTRDVPDRLRPSKQLYGRERESEVLQRALERVAVHGVPELVLISGAAGFGKSSLALSIAEPVARARGILATGKFEEYEPLAPYSAIARTFKDVVPYILAEGGEGVEAWRRRLADALGPIGQLVVDVVPALETVIGKQPAAPEVPLAEAESRFFLAFRRFVSALSSRDRVLVLVVDDLQWADAASLALLQHLVSHVETGSLLVIGTYGDNPAPEHPLHSFLREVRSRKTQLEEISLGPLTAENVTALCAGALSSSTERVAPLASLIWARSGGNALAVRQLLDKLERERVLVFDREKRTWGWDLARVRSASVCDDDVDPTFTRIQHLGRAAQEALELGACIGTRFDARTLALVTGSAADETRDALREAVSAGLLASSGGAYHFAHDRIRASVYEHIPEARRTAQHERIGRLLVEHLAPRELAERVFEVAGQLNLGAALLASERERDRVAELDLLAGQTAARASAFAAAASYLAKGIALLDASAWQRRHDLAYGLHLERARCELALGHLDDVERLIGVLREHVTTAAGRDRTVDRLAMEHHLLRGNVRGAVEIAIESLGGLGVALPLHPSGDDLDAAIHAVYTDMGDRTIEALVDLPLLHAPDTNLALEMLAALLAPAYLADPSLHCVVACRMASLSMRSGVSGPSSLGFAAFAMELVSRFGRADEGRRFAALALLLIERHGFLAYSARTRLVIGSFIAPRANGPRDAVELIRAAHKTALDVGDLTYAGYSSVQLIGARLAQGDRLDEVEAEARALERRANAKTFPAVAALLRMHVAFIGSLQGSRDDASTFSESGYDDRELVDASGSVLPITAVWFHIRKLQALCILRDHVGALEHAELARPLLWATAGQVRVAEYHFFAALAHAALAGDAAADERAAHLDEIAKHEEALRVWAQGGARTFFYMHALVAAERARVREDTRSAIQLYEESIRSARDNGFVHGEALAYESAARFYASLGLEPFAELYFSEASRRYRAWGAYTKARALDERHQDRPPGMAPVAARTELIPAAFKSALPAAPLYGDRREVAERQQAEATLRSVLDNLVDAVYVCDRTARVTFANPAAERLLGLEGAADRRSVEEMATRAHPLHPDGRPFVIDEIPILRALAGEVVSAVSMSIRDPHTERTSYLRVSAAPLQDENGAIAGAVAMTFNVTEAAELDRLKEQFVRVVAHELKTPITILKGYADLLRQPGRVPPEARLRVLDALVRGADRVDRLVTDLLLLWQLQGGRLALAIEDRVDLVEITSAAISRLDPALAHRVSVSAPGSLHVAADRQLVDRVVSNLVDNALRYSRDDGKVHVEVGAQDGDAVVTVNDQGVGIPADMQSRLFEPFFRAHTDTPNDSGGLGLGLYISKAIVVLHGGEIDFESEEGLGTTFRLTLPLRPRARVAGPRS